MMMTTTARATVAGRAATIPVKVTRERKMMLLMEKTEKRKTKTMEIMEKKGTIMTTMKHANNLSVKNERRRVACRPPRGVTASVLDPQFHADLFGEDVVAFFVTFVIATKEAVMSNAVAFNRSR
nr:uncharacterized protein LOC119187111 [Rhipicephalus microplus]